MLRTANHQPSDCSTTQTKVCKIIMCAVFCTTRHWGMLSCLAYHPYGMRTPAISWLTVMNNFTWGSVKVSCHVCNTTASKVLFFFYSASNFRHDITHYSSLHVFVRVHLWFNFWYEWCPSVFAGQYWSVPSHFQCIMCTCARDVQTPYSHIASIHCAIKLLTTHCFHLQSNHGDNTLPVHRAFSQVSYFEIRFVYLINCLFVVKFMSLSFSFCHTHCSSSMEAVCASSGAGSGVPCPLPVEDMLWRWHANLFFCFVEFYLLLGPISQ